MARKKGSGAEEAVGNIRPKTHINYLREEWIRIMLEGKWGDQSIDGLVGAAVRESARLFIARSE
ncbi:MAG: hypothetical protein ACK2T3_00270 [Candidatus Promineifilaceae bacterium]